VKNAYECLKQKTQDLNLHYNSLHDSAKQMNYSLERKEHDLNLMKAKANALEADNKEAFNLIITSLNGDIKKLGEEKDKIKTLWLESQKELVAQQHRYKELEIENDSLQTRLGIAEGVKHKAGKEMEVVKDESFEHKQEAAKLYNEMRKLQPVISDLTEKNRNLEQKLHESELKLQESHINHTTTKQMLRTEIRRLTQDRSTLRQDKAQFDKSVMHIERDTQIYKEMIDKLKSERYELQREVYELKRRADESDKKYFDLKIRLRQMEKIEAKRKSDRYYVRLNQCWKII
jgi:chromosome segregation ATPase